MPSKKIKHEKKKGAIYRFEKIRQRLDAFELLKLAKLQNRPVKYITKNPITLEPEIHCVQ